MATTADPDITVLEFSQLQDHIHAQLQQGQRTFATTVLADAVDITVPKVEEALVYLSRKHEYVTDIGGGQWKVEDRR